MTEEQYALFGLETEVPLQSSRLSQRRSHLEIRMDILTCVKTGVDKPTQIMYKANLSWGALKEHLEALVASELLKPVEYGNRKRFEITQRAITVLMAYRKVLQEIGAPLAKSGVTF